LIDFHIFPHVLEDIRGDDDVEGFIGKSKILQIGVLPRIRAGFDFLGVEFRRAIVELVAEVKV